MAEQYRLSPQQQRIWPWQAGEQATPCFVQAVVGLQGDLDEQALGRALARLCKRYEILRTAFPAVSGLKMPLQTVLPPAPPRLLKIDLSACSQAELERQIEAIADEGGRAEFEFEKGPLWQLWLLRIQAREHLLALRLPSLCCDAFSLSKLVGELQKAYWAEALDADPDPAGPPEDPLQFADLAEWQHELLESEEMESGRRFWREQQIGGKHALRLPFAEPQEASAPFSPQRLRLSLDGGLQEGLLALAEQRNASAGSLIAAAWHALLARLCEAPQVVAARLSDGRTYQELDSAIGPLGHMLPQGSSAEPRLQFLEFWRRQNDRWSELCEWQEYFSWPELDLPEGAAEPFCSLACECLSWPDAEDAPTAGLRFEPQRLYACGEPFEVKLSVLQLPAPQRRLNLSLDFDPRLYSEPELDRLAEQLLLILEQVCDRPSLALGELDLLTDSQRQRLLIEWNQTGRSWQPGGPVQRCFEQQCGQSPDRIALTFEERQISYFELDARANQLARRLKAWGTGPDAVVGMCLERSHQVVEAILGILKADGAYLPLDPSLPAERLGFMLSDCSAKALISQPGLLFESDLQGVPRIDLGEDAELAGCSRRALDAPERGRLEADGSNLAYVLYTSGSTGRPKGVGVEHRQLANYLRGVMERLNLPAETSYAAVSTFAADLGNTVVYAPLLSGGCLHVIAQPRLFDPEAFADYMSSRGIGCLKIVPSHLEALLAGPRPEQALPRQLLMLGGEASRWQWIGELQRLAPECRILNHYGPTETTVGVLTYAIEGGASRHGSGSPPIGRPLANLRAYILDRSGNPQPLWLPGELCLAGRNLSRGYLGRASLTAQRFVPDPFSDEPGGRLYRSGDLARRRPDGNIEFLGRTDDQVKIHGFRVEPGEIESLLGSHPAIGECVVLARRDEGSGQLRLVAYLVAQGEAPSVGELRSFLGQKLPEFMLPAAFMALPSLPLNPNGKLDRQRLPAPDPSQMRAHEDYVAPSTSAEKKLARVWSEVLGLDEVGIDDNFFHLGGDSIRSIELRAKARPEGLDFSIAEVFQHQTIRKLAQLLESRTVQHSEEAPYQPFSLVSQADRSRMPEGVEDAYPLSRMQQGMLFHSLSSTDAATYHDVGSYRFRMPFEPQAMRQAVSQLSARHPALRTTFDYSAFSQPLQMVHSSAEIPVLTEDWRHIPAEQEESAWEAWIDRESRRSFEWDKPPLLRIYLHRLKDGGCQVTVSFHHAILDGWSRHSMVTELIAEYLRRLDFEVPPLPDLPQLSYGEFVALEQQALDSQECRQYWRQRLEGSSRTVLPRRPAPIDLSQGLQARVHIAILPSDLSDSLHRLAGRADVSIKSLLLAAHLRVLSLLSGDPDVTTGLVVNGRPEKDAGDRVFGLFLNSLPLRCRLLGGSWLDLIRTAFEAEAGLLPYRRFPIAELQRLYGGGEHLLEINFNYMHYHIYRRVLEMPGLVFLGYKGFEETNLTCVVNFHQDPVSNDIQCGIEYHAAILFEEQIESMSRYLLATLQEMARHPEGRYEAFSPLSAAERHQLLIGWNDTEGPQGAGLCLHQLFEGQARRWPDRIAVAFGEQRLSYAGLDRRAGQMAGRLQRCGAGPEVPVALVAERSAELVTGLLGVLKAGSAYVPLDPDLPEARLEFLLQDVAPPCLLTQSRLKPRLPQGLFQILCLDAQWPAAQGNPLPSAPAGPGNAAYAIYTSGSTGQPKGVVNCHRAIVNRIVWMQQAYGLDSSDRVLQKTPYSFDVSVWEFFWPLAAGAQLVVARPEGHKDSLYLSGLIERQRISTLHFVPSMLQAFLEQKGLDRSCRSLRRVICSGEALSSELAKRALHSLKTELHNLYGPTEAAVDVTSWACRKPSLGSGVPIGRPITNLRIYLLDRQLLPVPVGVPGELYIAGTGLARGYWRRAGLTAERFIPDPCSHAVGLRFYRSGDLARFRPGGSIEFLQRIDHQVKIRGFRVELGEIEAALLGLESVREAVVTARGSGAEASLAGYFVPASEAPPDASQLRAQLRRLLPEYMVPSHLVPLESMPLTPNGKLNRKALPDPAAQAAPQLRYQAPQSGLERRLAEIWQDVLGLENVSVNENFFDLGGHSLHLVRLHVKLREALGRELAMVELFQYPTIRALSRHLSQAEDEQAPALGRQRAERRVRLRAGGEKGIAVIGMSCRFPGADGPDAFWDNLSRGVESVAALEDEEMLAAGVDPELLKDPRYIKSKGVLEDVDLFDAAFFNFNPLEASVLDPQQRLFLECAWQAMEDAGWSREEMDLETAVFAGIGMNTYAFNVYSNTEIIQSIGGYAAMLSNDKDFLATRVSYKLDLRGPSMTVQTACSTSLVAIHLACQSLLQGECDLALAGGVRVGVPHKSGYLHQEGGIHSADGHCRAFDAAASGTVGGDGAGAVILKRLSDALDDGDHIRAVIKGSAVNNDGAQRVGYTAPGVEGQVRVICEALAMAGVPPRSISCIEAHGTGTELGDPIEVEALTQAFRDSTDESGFCALGSLKTNVGHLDAAAGVAGLIKTVLSMEHCQLAPTLHYQSPNPRIRFEESPFYVNDRLRPWESDGTPRRAGVSSMGIGGTNAHLVLEEAPQSEPSGPSRPVQWLPLSARSAEALQQMALNLAEALEKRPELDLADVAYTLKTGRRRFKHRLAVICSSKEEAVDALRQGDRKRLVRASHSGEECAVAFLFPGQGAQYPGMAAGLYREESSFRRHIDLCAQILTPHLGLDLRKALFEEDGQGDRLTQTSLAQPAVFAVEYALARLLMEWGIQPDAMIGHSIGEYVAAALSGVWRLEDALALVAARGRLMQSLPPGAMLSVNLSEPELTPLLGSGLALAAVNAAQWCVASGPQGDIDDLASQLARQGVQCRKLHTSHAFHSPMMDPILEEFAGQAAAFELQPPQIPFLSNLSGSWIEPQEAASPGYWASHLRATVRFADGLSKLLEQPGRILLEAGPGQSLSTFARQHPDKGRRHLVLQTMRHPKEAGSQSELLQRCLARLWLAGAEISHQSFYASERRRRVPLPSYPFERRSYWIDAPAKSLAQETVAPASLARLEQVEDWFSVPRWRRASLPSLLVLEQSAADGDQAPLCLLLLDESGVGESLERGLAQRGYETLRVRVGQQFCKDGPADCTIDPRQGQHFEQLLCEAGRAPQRVVHLWTLGSRDNGPDPDAFEGSRFERQQILGIGSLTHLAQSLGQLAGHEPVEIDVVTDRLQAISCQEPIQPEKAPLMAACKVIPQEIAGWTCRLVDVALPPIGSRSRTRLEELLLAEILSPPQPLMVAYRGNERWLEGYERLPLAKAAEDGSGLRQDGLYLFSGGLGPMTAALARWLAGQAPQARLLVLERPDFPPQSAWASAEGDPDVEAAQALVDECRQSGARIDVLPTQWEDPRQLAHLIADASSGGSGLAGLLHAPDGNAELALASPVAEEDAARLTALLTQQASRIHALAEALKEERPDFCLCLFSNAAALGGLGSLPKAALGACLEAFASLQSRRAAAPWSAVSWDYWSAAERQQSRFDAVSQDYDMSPQEGLEVLQRLAAHADQPRLAVSPVDLGARLRVWIEKKQAQATSPKGRQHPRPELEHEYEAPRDGIEKEIAAIWQELLGIEKIGIHDDFFELGGHSLLATQLISRLQRAFKVSIPLRGLFESSTIADLSQLVLQRQLDLTGEEAVSELLAEVTSLSQQDLEALLSKEGRG